MALTQECILSFLLERGGKVKNSELLSNFGSQISCGDPAEKQHNRDLFKKLVNSVAVVKQIDGVKFVVVKKRYQDFIKEAVHDVSQKTQVESSPSLKTSFSRTAHRAESAKILCSDIENNNTCHPSHMNDAYYSGAIHMSPGSVQERGPLSRDNSFEEATTVKVLNLSGEHASRTRRSGAVFAVIAVKSPPRDSAPVTQGVTHFHVHQSKTPDEPVTLETKVCTLPVPTLNSPSEQGAPSVSKCWKSRRAEDLQPAGFPEAKSQSKTTRQGDDAKYSEPVPLEPLAHEWLVKCATGLWGQIYGLLLRDTRLAQRKDFMSGYTALHWAAKDGNHEMIRKLMDTAKKRGTYVNVNSKAHGGYTPLHIAAIHGHIEVMGLLVHSYGASVNERDNDGKKAFHYLRKDVPVEVRALLGGLEHSKYREKTEDGEYREHPKGFNTISKLFQPHVGKKQKTTTAKFAHDW